jgi:hypothetical protein
VSRFDTAEDKFVPVLDADELAFEIGLWLSGLESFLNIRNQSFADENRAKAASRDWTKEFRLTHSTLLLCSKLNFQLGKTLLEKKSAQKRKTEKPHSLDELTAIENDAEISTEEIYKLSLALKDSVLMNESLLRAAPLKFGEWTAWSAFLSERLKSTETFEKMILAAESVGEEYLPEIFRQIVAGRPVAEQSDLWLILPRFAKILKWLSVVGRMLKNDEPLKPTLLIFARVYEQIQEMIAYINNRLLRFPDEESELFSSLDGAAYTASIELKKVFSQELIGLVGIRPAPAVYARIETSYALLNDSFQQTLVVFAQMIDPEINARKIFPNFQTKFEQSVILRRDLWQILQTVQQTEIQPDEVIINSLNSHLTKFLNHSLQFLFYKDKETVERFVEEILITKNKKDLVPILHRFGAYLETLFGQVNMRTVLASHPFER